MELKERLQYILLRIKKLQNVIQEQQTELARLRDENNELINQRNALKKTNFEQNKKIEIANIANQLSDEKSDATKRKLDKYIREVDAVITALKKME